MQRSPELLNLSLLVKRSLPALLLLGIALYLAQSGHHLISQWSSHLTYLPGVALILCGAMAWRFGRSRMLFCCVLLGLLLLPPDSPLASYLRGFSVHLCLMAGMVYLLFAKDKGFAPVNLLLPLVMLALMGVASQLLLEFTSQQRQVLPVVVSNQLTLWLPANVAPVQGIYVLLAWLLGFVALLRRPTNNNAVLYVSLLLLPILAFAPSNALLTTRLCVFTLAVLYMLSVIMDSHDMAFRDELTGIPGRRALMQYVQTLGKRYVVVMADIDHFKSFNDTYGHDVGDQVLKLVASKLRKVTGGGKAFRYGGEEFTLVFAGKDPEQVVPHVDALRQAIQDYAMVIRAKDRPKKKSKSAKPQKQAKQKTVKVTCSFGIASRSKEASEFQSVMKQADLALYDAKKAGRNCVKIKA
ncbi:GGDEF domain-containing protein [Aliiglaciecola sp. CAU 1673]|uniref:GGDEF domain-containing protein n=1 Tax=Aliiglaciecola sp. CAU 1673 TaxID=3032595 RepID=UPI0023D9D70B|nr:GGDEF domain-containing protein [Aliiglaciecola sp. CAU 1673]MDF2179820.1 GGDEF domain-containing protein [Aliiglaciecola sp. CAU 1673]